jgi:hypothetical protein
MGISYTHWHIHFPCLNMARVGCNITDSYLDRGASRKGSIALQPYFTILAFQMIVNFPSNRISDYHYRQACSLSPIG